MGTWGSGIFQNDSAQDFLDGLRGNSPDGRVAEIAEMLERTASEPSVIMREYVPEEIVVAAAIVAVTMSDDSRPDWTDETALQDVVAGIDRQNSLSAVAICALQAVVSFQDGWLISSLKDDGDRRSLQRQLDEIRRMLEVN